MKNFVNYLSYAPRKFFVALLTLSLVAMPLVGVLAAEDVTIEGSLGVANQTAGETRWEEATNASFDDEVIFQVYYHNRELCDTNLVAENLAVNINLPQMVSGTNQVVSATIKGDNTNTVNDSVAVTLDRADAALQFMPGTVVWKHNNATDGTENIVTESLADSVVTGEGFQVIENVQPCAKYDATITFKARVIVPAVEVTKYVRVLGESEWVRVNTAQPGDTLEYAIGYKNAGNTNQNQVIIRDSLPPTLDYVEGSTMLKNASTSGQYEAFHSDEIVDDGIIIGNYTPGSNAFVMFQAVVPAAAELECGVTEYRNVGVVQPQGMNEFFNTTSTTVENECEEQPEEPNYVCEALSVSDATIKAGETVTFTANAQADNGATIKNYTFVYGDGETETVTSNQGEVTREHTYAEDNVYFASVDVAFDVDGEEVSDTGNEDCRVKVTVGTPETPEEPETPETPKELPNTGPGEVAMAAFGTGALGQGVRVWLSSRRKLSSLLLNK